MEQYYKNTLRIAIAKYKAGAMNAIGLLFDYVKVKFKPEWKITLVPKQVCQELGISSSTFYRTLKKVQELIGKSIYLRYEKVIPINGTEIPTKENLTPTHEAEIPTRGNPIPTHENENLQTTNKTNISSDTPDIRSDLDQISFSKVEQIPTQEREKFLLFAMSKADDLPKRPILPKKWIAANLSDLYSEFKKQSAPETQKTTRNRHFFEWYNLMRQLGHLKGQKIDNGVQLVEDSSGMWSTYEHKAKFWTLEYLKRCVAGK